MATPSQFNRPYAMNTLTQVQGGAPSQFNQLQASPFGSNSLANRAPVPVGRSMNDIGRIAEQQRRRGNFRPIMQLGMMGQEQNFEREMNDARFNQNKQMFDIERQAIDARDQTQRGYQLQDYQRNQTEAQRMEDARRQWDMTQYGIKLGDQAMEQERQRQQAELDRQRVPNVSVIPYEGGTYGATVVDGRPMGNIPMKQPSPMPSMQPAAPGSNLRIPMIGNERIPGMPLFEAQPNPGWSVKGQPKETLAPLGGGGIPKIQHFEKDGVKVPHEYNPKTGRWRPVQFEDANGNGIDDKKEQSASTTAPNGKPVSSFLGSFGNQ